MTRIVPEDEIRRRISEGLLAGADPSKNRYPLLSGEYPGPLEITPILEQGIIDYPVVEEPYIPESERVPENLRDNELGYMHPSRKEIRIRDENRMDGGRAEYNRVLIHELRHGGLNYLRENPHLMPYIMHYLQYDEGEFGRSLRDVLKDAPEGDVLFQTPEHRMIDAVDPLDAERSEEVVKEGLLGPEIVVSGFQSPEQRAQYVQMMREANEALARARKKKN